MKESTTTRISAEALRKADRSESRTDRERLRRMTESELEESIASDPDWNRVPQDWYLKAQAVMPTPKKLVSVRLDADLLAWFKSLGKGLSDAHERRSAVVHGRGKEAGRGRPFTVMARNEGR